MNTITITIPASHATVYFKQSGGDDDVCEKATDLLCERFGGLIGAANATTYLLAENARLKALMRKKEYSKSIWEGEVAKLKLKVELLENTVDEQDKDIAKLYKENEKQSSEISELEFKLSHAHCH